MTSHVYTDITLLLEKWYNEGVSEDAQKAALEQALSDVKARLVKNSDRDQDAAGDSFDNMPV